MTSEAIQKLRSAEKTYHLGWGDLEFTSWQDEDALRVQDLSACPINPFQLQIAGPKALPLLDELCGAQIRDVPFMRFREVQIAGEKVVLWTI